MRARVHAYTYTRRTHESHTRIISIYLSIYLSINLSIYVSIHLSIHTHKPRTHTHTHTHTTATREGGSAPAFMY